MSLPFRFEPSSRKGTKAESVTSLSFAPRSQSGESGANAVLALGLESGFIELWTVPTGDFETRTCELLLCLPPAFCHIATVSKLAWRPLRDDDGMEQSGIVTLASCSLDRGCRIFELEF